MKADGADSVFETLKKADRPYGRQASLKTAEKSKAKVTAKTQDSRWKLFFVECQIPKCRDLAGI